MVSGGVDPRVKQVAIPTFAEASEIVIGIDAEGWRNPKVAVQWKSSMDNYVLPTVGRKLVS